MRENTEKPKQGRTAGNKKHAFVVKKQKIRRNYTWLAGLVLIAILAVVCFAVKSSSNRLEQKNAELDRQIAAYTRQQEEQIDRRAQLEEYEKYITTKQFVIDFAREKLGLVFEDELIFRQK